MTTKRAFLSSLLINIFFLVLCLVFGNLIFGATDDYFMARLLEGVYGEGYNVHLTFVNVLYGYALLPLYHLFPKIGWYYVGEMVGVFLSFTTIGFVLIKKVKSLWGPILAALFTAAFASDCYLSVQFTQCAAIFAATGMLLFVLFSCLTSNFSEKKRIFLLIASIFFIFWGAIMRSEAFLMGTPFFALALISNLRSCWFNKNWVLIGVTIVLVGLFSIQWIDKKHYESADYKYYKDFQSARATIGDGTFFDEAGVSDDLDEIGYYGEDLHLLRNWIFNDREVFSVDSLNMYIKYLNSNKRESSRKSIFQSFFIALSCAAGKPMFWIWFLFCATIATSRKGACYAWGSIVIISVLTCILILVSRVVFRVELGFWLYATVLSIPYIGNLPKISNRIQYCILGIILVSSLVVFYRTGDIVRNQTNGRSMSTTAKPLKHYDEALAYIRSLPSNQIALTSHIPYMFFVQKMNPPYLSEPYGNWKKIVPIGYWTPFFPDIEKHLHSIGINNPLKDVTKDNVIVVSNGQLADYLQRHYNVEVDVTTIRSFDGLNFYKYFVKSPEIP